MVLEKKLGPEEIRKLERYTTQRMKFFIKDFFSKCDQIRRRLRIWSHLLKKSLMEIFIFCGVIMKFEEPVSSRYYISFQVDVEQDLICISSRYIYSKLSMTLLLD